jgi:hypothetical protein
MTVSAKPGTRGAGAPQIWQALRSCGGTLPGRRPRSWVAILWSLASGTRGAA